MPHFLGHEFLTFEKARAWAIKQGITSQTDWEKFTKDPGFPANIPKHPRAYYKNDGFKSMPHFLGYEV